MGLQPGDKGMETIVIITIALVVGLGVHFVSGGHETKAELIIEELAEDILDAEGMPGVKFEHKQTVVAPTDVVK